LAAFYVWFDIVGPQGNRFVLFGRLCVKPPAPVTGSRIIIQDNP